MTGVNEELQLIGSSVQVDREALAVSEKLAQRIDGHEAFNAAVEEETTDTLIKRFVIDDPFVAAGENIGG